MPVTGTIVEVNEEIKDDLELLGEDSYDEGWLLLIEPSNLDDDPAELVHCYDVKAWFDLAVINLLIQKKVRKIVFGFV